MTSSVRIADKQKLFECDFPDCFRFYESLDKLAGHKYLVHNQQGGFDPTMMQGGSRFPGMAMPVMGGMVSMPMMGMQMMSNQGMSNMNMMNPNFNMP